MLNINGIYVDERECIFEQGMHLFKIKSSEEEDPELKSEDDSIFQMIGKGIVRILLWRTESTLRGTVPLGGVYT